MNRLEVAWLHQVKERDGISSGARVLVACSGGGDSMALLTFLHAIRKSLSLTLCVAHAHHHLREAGDEDAILVRDHCRDLNVDCMEGHLNVKDYARHTGMGLETAARELRWAWLKNQASATQSDYVATGHTLDDHTETVFIRLTRGGGIGALTPLPARQGLRWSPLIEVPRERLRHYLKQKHVPWREDESNEEAFTIRNRWRKHLVHLRQEAPGLDRHLMETHRQVQELRLWRDEQILAWEGIRWCLNKEGQNIEIKGPLTEVELRWVLDHAFQRFDWEREAQLLRDLAAWIVRFLLRPPKKSHWWGNWHLEPLPQGGWCLHPPVKHRE